MVEDAEFQSSCCLTMLVTFLTNPLRRSPSPPSLLRRAVRC
jgi:hypothetical protein